jgi:hypothetical protein
MSEQKTLIGSIALDRLISVKMTKNGKDGKPVEGLFIPIEVNKLEVNDYGIQMPVRVLYNPTQDSKGQNGFISKSIGSVTYKAASTEQQAAYKDYNNEATKLLTPILGNLKDFSSGSSSANVKSKVVSGPVVDADHDDLPF